MASQRVRCDLTNKQQQQRDRTGAVGPFLSRVPRSRRSEFTFSHLYHKDVQAGLRPNCQDPLDSLKKQESSRKTSISALLTMLKPLTVWITINCGKF